MNGKIYFTIRSIRFAVLFSVCFASILTGWAYVRISHAIDGHSDMPLWNKSGEYYEIDSTEALMVMRDWVNGGNSADQTYILTSDIDLREINWTPIGNGNPNSINSSTKIFRGVFDGGGHTIANLTIKSADYNSMGAGLFGIVSGNNPGGGGVIRNLNVISCDVDIVKKIDTIITSTFPNINSKLYAGILAAYLSGDVSNCFASGNMRIVSDVDPKNKLNAYNQYTGLLAGYNRNNIRNCRTVGRIEANASGEDGVGAYTAGIAALNDGNIEFSFASVNINSRAPKLYCGGITGNNSLSGRVDVCGAVARISAEGSNSAVVGGVSASNRGGLSKCFAAGYISAANPLGKNSGSLYCGGIAGDISISNSSAAAGLPPLGLRDSYSICDLSSDVVYVGGVSGRIDALKSASSGITAQTSYYCGGISGNALYKGGVAGAQTLYSTIKSCDWLLPGADGKTGIAYENILEAKYKTNQLIHARSLDAAGFKSMENFQKQGWDFDDTWCYSELNSRSRPLLRAFLDNADTSRINPDLTGIFPDKVTVRADEVREIALLTLLEAENVTFSTAKERGVNVMWDKNSPRVIIVSADAATKGGELEIEVGFTINGIPQHPKKLSVNVIHSPNWVDPVEENSDAADSGGGENVDVQPDDSVDTPKEDNGADGSQEQQKQDDTHSGGADKKSNVRRGGGCNASSPFSALGLFLMAISVSVLLPTLLQRK